jgi:hypothetical protein
MIKEDQIKEQAELNAPSLLASEKKKRPQKPERIEKELPALYDTVDVMRMLHISESTLYRMRKKKEIPFKKVGGKYFYPAYYFENINLEDTK